jgi:hypothetical protein
MDRVFTHTYHVTGTLSANVVSKFKLPCDAQLIYACANASNTNNATLILGPSTDTDGYLESAAIGQSGTPVEFDWNDFVGSQYPHIAKGTIFTTTLDYDGSAGSAAANFDLLLMFTEG